MKAFWPTPTEGRNQNGGVNRAQALATEHTEVAPMNMRLALERRAESEQVMPGIPGIPGNRLSGVVAAVRRVAGCHPDRNQAV